MKTYCLVLTLFSTYSLCQAQMNSQSTVHTPSRGYVQPFDLNVYKDVAIQREQAYQQNYQSILDKLEGLRSRLEDLRSLDDESASSIELSLRNYLAKLDQVDLSNSTNYTIITNSFRQINEQISQAYRNLRQQRASVPSQMSQPVSSGKENINRVAGTILYARIFQKPDFGSDFVHSVSEDETVRILGVVNEFYYVRCGKYEGYLSKGMIKQFRP